MALVKNLGAFQRVFRQCYWFLKSLGDLRASTSTTSKENYFDANAARNHIRFHTFTVSPKSSNFANKGKYQIGSASAPCNQKVSHPPNWISGYVHQSRFSSSTIRLQNSNMSQLAINYTFTVSSIFTFDFQNYSLYAFQNARHKLFTLSNAAPIPSSKWH